MTRRPASSRRRPLLRLAAASLGGLALPAPVARAASPSLVIGQLRNPVAGVCALAEQKGWFKDAGLDLRTELFTGAGGPKLLQAMGGGSIGIGSVSATAALLALGSGAVPLRIVSISTDPAPVFAILSAPEIDSVPKLAGRKVATTAGTGLQYFLVRALAKHGMTLKDVEFVNLPVGDAQAAFLAGRVDAVVPSLTGRYYVRTLRKDTRELFTHDAFTRPPGPTTPFEDYDVFVAPASVVQSAGPALRAFLSVYHGKAVPFLRDPATQADAIGAITRYVNTEQKSPTDEAAMREQLSKSGFFDVAQTQRILRSDGFRAGLEDQVRFLTDAKQAPARIALDGVIVTDLV